MRVVPYGDRAVLVEVATAKDVPGAAAALRAFAARPRSGIVDVVPAARTVLVVIDPSVRPVDDVRRTVEALDPLGDEVARGPTVTIDVRYDGADLAAVAERTGLTEREVVRRHTEPDYTVAFCGFAPGFAYLVGLDPALVLPRHADPRPRVPAGSVAIAAEYCGVYPRAMPGGWNLLGRTDAPLWDLGRTPPALLAPGAGVRFRAVH